MAAPLTAGPAPSRSQTLAALCWRVAQSTAALAGWRRVAAAVGAGAVSVLALAPFFFPVVLFVTLPLLVWLIDGAVTCRPADAAARLLEARRAARAAFVGWLFGFGYFFAGLFWIGEAFLVEAERFAWALPFAVTLLPAGLALLWAAATAGAALLWRPGLERVVALAVALSGAEWLRGHILTGFPWNVVGYAITWPLPLMQSSGLVGIYGLTLITILIFASPLVLVAHPPKRLRSPRAAAIAAFLVTAVPLTLMALYGWARLGQPASEPIAGVRLRLVQPSVPQREKWRPEKFSEIFLDHLVLSLTRPDGVRDELAGITQVVWPEAAMPFLPLHHPEALRAIGDMLPDGTSLLSGALRIEDDAASPLRRRGYNSLMVFGSDGSLTGLYDKNHLVPFGEYLPLQSFLESLGLEQLTRWRGGFTAGPYPRPLLSVPGLPPVGSLICYEAIFPRDVVQGQQRPQLLINITNDGWFGNTTGPRQHFHQARVRAVEEGLTLIRVANNGISAAIDPEGRVLGRLELNQRGTLDTLVPKPRAMPPYARYGDLPFAICWMALLLWLLRRTGGPSHSGLAGN